MQHDDPCLVETNELVFQNVVSFKKKCSSGSTKEGDTRGSQFCSYLPTGDNLLLPAR